MNCPYFDEGYFGTCGASQSRYVPTIERMETYCFKKAYRLCPTLSKYLCDNDIAMANYPLRKKLFQPVNEVSSSAGLNHKQ